DVERGHPLRAPALPRHVRDGGPERRHGGVRREAQAELAAQVRSSATPNRRVQENGAMRGEPQEIVVVGGGFAGLWAALGAVRHLDELGAGPGDVRVTLINRDAWHSIRVRNYEADIADARLPLAEVLPPAGIQLLVGSVSAIDLGRREVMVAGETGQVAKRYDRLGLAPGRPP